MAMSTDQICVVVAVKSAVMRASSFHCFHKDCYKDSRLSNPVSVREIVVGEVVEGTTCASCDLEISIGIANAEQWES